MIVVSASKNKNTRSSQSSLEFSFFTHFNNHPRSAHHGYSTYNTLWYYLLNNNI